MQSLKEFRKKVKEQREKEFIRDALLLRRRSPEYSLNVFFDLCKFSEEVRKAGDKAIKKREVSYERIKTSC